MGASPPSQVDDWAGGVELTGDQAVRLGVTGETLTVRRAWPRDENRITLEYVDAGGRTLAGQWFADAGQLRKVGAATAGDAGDAVDEHVLMIAQRSILMQSAGADRRLKPLREMASRPGAALLAHRAERRAVLRLGQSGDAHPTYRVDRAHAGPAYVKVLRPGRTELVALAAQRSISLSEAATFHVPQLLGHDAAGGIVTLSELPGRTLHELLGGAVPDVIGAGARLGGAIRALHDAGSGVVQKLPLQSADAVLAWLGTWVARVEHHLPHLVDQAGGAHAQALVQARRSLDGPVGDAVPVHADLHDGQVVIDPAGGVGILDWDTLARGEAALDLANLLAHLELRVLTGEATSEHVEQVAAAVLEGYDAPVHLRVRVQEYAPAIRLRLACQYAFRPAQSAAGASLLASLDSRLPGLDPSQRRPRRARR